MIQHRRNGVDCGQAKRGKTHYGTGTESRRQIAAQHQNSAGCKNVQYEETVFVENAAYFASCYSNITAEYQLQQQEYRSVTGLLRQFCIQ